MNDWLDEEQINEGINEIKRVGLRKGLVKANEDFLSTLLEPPAFKNKKNLQEKGRNIKIIDFDEPLKNDFLAINQFRVNTPGTLRDYIVPDIVLFVNGLPIVIVNASIPLPLMLKPWRKGSLNLRDIPILVKMFKRKKATSVSFGTTN